MRDKEVSMFSFLPGFGLTTLVLDTEYVRTHAKSTEYNDEASHHSQMTLLNGV